jgi:hypothetical protein
MLHIPGFGGNGVLGYSPISYMREPIGGQKGAERYGSELFANDGRPAGVITVPGPLSDAGYERTKKDFNEMLRDKRHSIPLLEQGATFAETQMHPQDVQMIETRRFGIEEIARAYRIPPPLLQDLTHGTYSNVTELGRWFIVYTMRPWLKRWQGEINRKLLEPPFFAEFNVNAFMQGDPAAQATYFFKLFSIGGMTINRILELINENPIGPEGDERFVPGNLIPLNQAIAGERVPGPPKPPTPPESGERQEADGAGDMLSDGRRMSRIGQRAWEIATRELLAKESRAADRAAKSDDNFVQWVDEFYQKHLPLCVEKFEVAALALGFSAERFARIHVGLSKDALLSAAECSLEELPATVAAAFEIRTETRTLSLEDSHVNSNG